MMTNEKALAIYNEKASYIEEDLKSTERKHFYPTYKTAKQAAYLIYSTMTSFLETDESMYVFDEGYLPTVDRFKKYFE